MNSLPLSETFYSIQGEGPSMGVPALFLRLKGCNLTCGGQNTVKTKKLDSGATWRCDTIEVWMTGKTTSFDDIILDWDKKGFLEQLKQGAHLIITGGEPLLHQEALSVFLDQLKSEVPDLFVEVETNATILPKKAFLNHVSQLNLSPKLANSGMAKEKRLIPEVLRECVQDSRSCFKFVVSSKEDLAEIKTDFIDPFKISAKQVYLMPGCSTREELIQMSGLVSELALENGYRFSSRLQLAIWDQAVGV